MNYLGIDIGGTAAKIGLVTCNGDILHSASYNVAFDNYQTPILHTVLNKTDDFLQSFHINPKNLAGIGISATGQIDTINGIVAGSGGNIKNWLGSNIKSSFEEKYGLKTTVVNDANCVAIGEQWVGAAKNSKNAIIITIGTGVGGGIIVNNEILLGSIGIAGEIGHFSIDQNGKTCTCGNKGCIEQYGSMTALIKSVKEIAHEIPLNPNSINGLEIFKLVKEKNEKVCHIVDQWINSIISCLVSLTHIFNPEVIIIGGGVSAEKELFVSKVAKGVYSRVMPKFKENLQIKPAKLGNNAGLVGAVRYCMLN